jgi:hypothetical protein
MSGLKVVSWVLTLSLQTSILSIFSVHNRPSIQNGTSNGSTLWGDIKALLVS